MIFHFTNVGAGEVAQHSKMLATQAWEPKFHANIHVNPNTVGHTHNSSPGEREGQRDPLKAF